MASKPSPISGFPELLPEEQIVLANVVSQIRKVAELFGFRPQETRSVERLEDLLSKSDEIDKEMYVLRRLGADASSSPAKLGLRYDLTVPLARYVIQNNSSLVFPYRRFQIGPVWRGERPQDGRYREFIQADFDIVGRDHLPPTADAEVLAVVHEALSSLPLPPITLKVNSRTYFSATLDELDVSEELRRSVLQQVDKVDKVGRESVRSALIDVGLGQNTVDELDRRLLDPSAGGSDALEAAARLPGPLGEAAVTIQELMTDFEAMCGQSLEFSPSLVRGLDYYTGMIMESTMQGWESLGSVCSGGRYDELAQASGKTFPGVGMSIGISRILVPFSARRLLTVSRPTPTVVLVASQPDSGTTSLEVASDLRRRGVATEVGAPSATISAQMKYTDRLRIPYYLRATDEGWELRDMVTGDRSIIDPSSWYPEASAQYPSWSVADEE